MSQEEGAATRTRPPAGSSQIDTSACNTSSSPSLYHEAQELDRQRVNLPSFRPLFDELTRLSNNIEELSSDKLLKLLEDFDAEASTPPIALILLLRKVLYLLEAKENCVTPAHRAASVLVLKAFEGRTKVVHNRYHEGPVNSVGVSHDARYLATGSTGDLDKINHHAEGAIAIWELETGRCVNVIGAIDCGFCSMGCLLWNPVTYHFGLNTETNLIKFYDPFTAAGKDFYCLFTFGDYGYSRPPKWSWCKNNRCVITSLVVANLYDENHALNPHEELIINDDDGWVIDKNRCPEHYRGVDEPEQKSEDHKETDEGDDEEGEAAHRAVKKRNGSKNNEGDAPPHRDHVESLRTLCIDVVCKLFASIEDDRLTTLPVELAQQVCSRFIKERNYLDDPDKPPSPKRQSSGFSFNSPPKDVCLFSLCKTGKLFAFGGVASSGTSKGEKEGGGEREVVRLWTTEPRYLTTITPKGDLSSLEYVLWSPEGTKIAIGGRHPEQPDTLYRSEIWAVSMKDSGGGESSMIPSVEYWTSIDHQRFEDDSWGNQPDPHRYTALRWSGEDTLFAFHYNADGSGISKEAPSEQLICWHVDKTLGAVVRGRWDAFKLPTGFDLAPRKEHPLNREVPRRWNRPSNEEKKPYEAFEPPRDPVFFYLLDQNKKKRKETTETHPKGEKEEAITMTMTEREDNDDLDPSLEWHQVAVFDSGLVVFSDPSLPIDEILRNEISYSIDRRHGWPYHWSCETPFSEIAIGWEQALKSPKLPFDFPRLQKLDPERQLAELSGLAYYKTNSVDGVSVEQPIRSLSLYKPLEDQKITADQIIEDPSILEPLVGKSIIVKKKEGSGNSIFSMRWERDSSIQASLVRLITRRTEIESGRSSPFSAFPFGGLSESEKKAQQEEKKRKEDEELSRPDADKVKGIEMAQFFPSGNGWSSLKYTWTDNPQHFPVEWLAPARTVLPKVKELWYAYDEKSNQPASWAGMSFNFN